jgi:hypothetical protein
MKINGSIETCNASLEKFTHHSVLSYQGGVQQMQHYKLLLQELTKRNAGQVEAFKTALKVHAEHVKERQKRVNKYGQGHEQLKAGSGMSSEASQYYAMFNRPSLIETSSHSHSHLHSQHSNSNNHMSSSSIHIDETQRSQELRRRGGPQAGPGSPDKTGSDRPGKEISPYSNAKPGTKPTANSGGGGGGFFGNAVGGLAGGASRILYGSGGGGGLGSEQAQMQQTRTDSRYSSAQKVEASIAQVLLILTSLSCMYVLYTTNCRNRHRS